MQASPAWTPPGGTLGRIVAETRQRVDSLETKRAELAARARDVEQVPSFRAALLCDRVGVIAEVKRRSPSKGWINADIAASDQAAFYERGGAAAISVLTESANFGGSCHPTIMDR